MCEVLDFKSIEEQQKPLTDSQRVKFTKEIKGNHSFVIHFEFRLCSTLEAGCGEASGCVSVWTLYPLLIPVSPRSKGRDHSLWADEEEVQSVQRDQKTSQPPDVSPFFFFKDLAFNM